MNEKKIIDRKIYLLILSIVLGLIALVWIVFLSDKYAIIPTMDYLLKSLGEQWINENKFYSFIIVLITSVFPSILLILFSILFGLKFRETNSTNEHDLNLKELESAKTALKNSFKRIKVMEQDYKLKIKLYSELLVKIDNLNSLKETDKATLKKKLDAINLANRKPKWIQIALGYIIGILTSLSASYIWEKVSNI